MLWWIHICPIEWHAFLIALSLHSKMLKGYAFTWRRREKQTEPSIDGTFQYVIADGRLLTSDGGFCSGFHYWHYYGEALLVTNDMKLYVTTAQTSFRAFY